MQKKWGKIMYDFKKPDNLIDMLENSLEKHADREWLGTKNGKGYNWVTYGEMGERINNLRGGLASIGVEKGDTVAVLCNNSVEWAVICYAANGRGARFVPMYAAELPQIWKYIVDDSNTKILFVAEDEVYEQVKNWPNEIEGLEKVCKIYGSGEGSMTAPEETGKASPVETVRPGPDDIAGLIYTSGTTGDPKGVKLSHGNFTSNIHDLLKGMHMLDGSYRSLAIIPWAHGYGQNVELHAMMSQGASCGFAEAPTTVVEDLQLVKPTILFGVPRIFSKVYDSIQAKMDDDGGLAKALFDMGINSAAKKKELAKKGKSSFMTNFKLKIADKIVFSKIRDKFGGRLEFSFSSGSKLNATIGDFFFDIGIPIFEAWGMTELAPTGTLNTPEAYKIGSVGKALDSVTVKIDKSVLDDGGDEGELIVYGPNVMKGYNNKPEATRAVFTDDGGLRSGDRAYIDEDGFIFITGRIKDQFKLENGKFVIPGALEEEITLLPYVEQAMIHGLNEPYTVCLVAPDFVVMEKYAKEHGLPTDPEEMVKNREIISFLEDKIVEHLSGKFGKYEIPKKFVILKEGFTVENEMMTPVLKLKRRIVEKTYENEISSLYTR